MYNEPSEILLKGTIHALRLAVSCARYATVILSFVPTDLKTCCQNADTNFLSRSETMLVGIPCNFQMCSMKRRATPSAVTFFVVGTKWHRLGNLSTTTQIESTSRFVRGRSVMQSMVIDRHRSSGIFSGSSRPDVFGSRGLFRRQGSQSAMNFWIDFNMLDQYQRLARVKNVRSAPV
ncbi:hypothetical protein PHMEG_00024091 [Phytophthora megakarya]|uniref:Uncharacterized protein n=1 Tax=Phytophthora megakarya TaxID=4795 RepID=A0A225VFD0_9STRA|nr:hypothetical protein PHMEG_00024091 [Phytophthora megakarya]